MRSVILVFLAVLLVSQVSAGHVYAVVTTLGGNGTETVQQTVRANDNNGQIDVVATNLIITGSSLMYDGISTFNDDQGILYYCPDWPAPFIFGTDVNKKQITAPIYVPGQLGVSRMEYDDATGNLYALVLVKKGKLDDGVVVSIPQRNAGGFAIVAAFNLNTVEYGTDAYNEQFFVLAKPSNATQYDVVTMILNTGNYTVTPVPCAMGKAIPNYFVYDPNTQLFYIVADSGTGYTLMAADLNANTCKHVPLGLPKGSIALSFTYDRANTRLWVGLADSAGGYLYGYSTATGALYKVIQIPYVPEVIEFASAH